MHQCIQCKKLYNDDEVPILDGCECGGRLFLLVKEESDMDRADMIYEELTEKIEELKKKEIQKEQESVEEPAEEKAFEEKPDFGIETVKVKSPGVYEIDLEALMAGEPIVVLSKGGSYIISLPSAFGHRGEVDLKRKT